MAIVLFSSFSGFTKMNLTFEKKIAMPCSLGFSLAMILEVLLVGLHLCLLLVLITEKILNPS